MTKRGRATYKKRSRTVEPAFGQIKDARGAGRFLLRGLDGASGEWKLPCGPVGTTAWSGRRGTHNLLKLWRSGRASWN